MSKKIFIQQWINGKCGKNHSLFMEILNWEDPSLANYILRDFIKIDVNIDFCKTNQTLDTFLDLSLYKKK